MELKDEVLKEIPESAVIQQVKTVINATSLKVQRINTGCFTVGEGKNRQRVQGYERRLFGLAQAGHDLRVAPEAERA